MILFTEIHKFGSKATPELIISVCLCKIELSAPRWVPSVQFIISTMARKLQPMNDYDDLIPQYETIHENHMLMDTDIIKRVSEGAENTGVIPDNVAIRAAIMISDAMCVEFAPDDSGHISGDGLEWVGPFPLTNN